jgi:hypothetical protein
MGLLARPEVQSEIHLDLRQKAALAELQGAAPAQMREQMRQNMQQLQGLTPEQRTAKLQELGATLRAQTQQMQGELTKKVEEILRPNQIARLHELDLQYRGAVALADAKVAEDAKISPEHRVSIAKINGDYQAKVQELVQEFMADMRDRGVGPGNPPGAGPAPGQRRVSQAGPADFQSMFAPVQKKIDVLKKDADEKALAALDDEEKKRWTALQGEPFTFRKDTQNRNRTRG